MKRRFLFPVILLFTLKMYAQVPEDAIRMSWNPISGTARSQAIGGAVGALGADISTLFVNPAGLGVYKREEIVLSPGYNFLKNSGDFRGTNNTTANNSKFALGTSGIVFNISSPYSPWNQMFSIAVNRTADFNSKVHYKGLNTLSSYSQQFLEEAALNSLDTNSVYNYPFTSGLAYYTYLIDTIRNPNGSFGGFKSLATLGTGLNQEKTVTSNGGISEIALGIGASRNDRFYIGASLGIPIVNYNRTTVFRESDATSSPSNQFNYSEYTQYYSAKGVGFNLKLGTIFKPADALRIGLSIHTPTFYGLSEHTRAAMTTDTENYPPSPGKVSVTSDELNNKQSAYFKYTLVSPWKFLVSGAYIFGQEENVQKQKGFISADLEWITHGSSRFSGSESDYNQGNQGDYYDGVNNITKQLYKGALNARLGGELKFNALMIRGGFSYYSNPNRDKELKARRMNISGGLGYRDKGMFIDLTYVHQLTRDVDFPYRLSEEANTFATINGTGGQVLLTFGFKF